MNKLIKSSFALFLLIGFALSLSANTASAATYMPGCNAKTIYSATTGKKCNTGEVLGVSADYYSSVDSSVEAEDITPVFPTLLDSTPRIMYWFGKVNQSTDAQGNWKTDPDGVSGANIDKLTYCKKWFPNTTSVQPYKTETVTWRAAGNTGAYPYAQVSDKCVQGTTVEKPTVTVLSPNGGETFTAGQQITVKWNSSNLPATQAILISLQGNFNQGYQLNNREGLVFESSMLNDGIEVVILPVLGSWPQWDLMQFGEKYKIKVETQTGTASDLSDNLFTIKAPTTISLDPTPRIAYYWGKVNQHTDEKGNWVSDSDGKSGANLDKLTYCKKWYPNTTSVESYKNETITTWKRENVYEQSNYAFTVMTDKCVQGKVKPIVTVTTPNGGEVFALGDSLRIAWKIENGLLPSTATAYIVDMANPSVEYKVGRGDDGFGTTIMHDPAIKNAPSLGKKNFKVKVYEERYGIVDWSDDTFTIAMETKTCPKNGPLVKVLSPNGGEVYRDGQEIIVKWESCNITQKNVSISLLIYNDQNVPITSFGTTGATLNDGYEVIPLPKIKYMREGNPSPEIGDIKAGLYYKIVVTAGSGAQLQDLSDNLFTIKDSTTTTLDPTPRVAMRYGLVNQKVDAQGNWLTDPDGKSGAGTYAQWGAEGYGDRKLEYCKKWYPNTIKVEPYKNEMIAWLARGNTPGYSYEVMTDKCVQGTTIGAPSITVLSPNGGEIYEAGQKITVNWKTSNIPTNTQIRINLRQNLQDSDKEYSAGVIDTINDGSEEITLHTKVFSGSAEIPFWPDMVYGKNFRAWVGWIDSPVVGMPFPEDSSDNTFTIQASTVTPTQALCPNGMTLASNCTTPPSLN